MRSNVLLGASLTVDGESKRRTIPQASTFSYRLLHVTAARRLTQNEADAEDLVAETLTRAWRARASLTDAGAFRAWLFRILNNTFISDRRKTLARPRR
jgi:DNA-directed RNA polymerase specialized sigma24 family protein